MIMHKYSGSLAGTKPTKEATKRVLDTFPFSSYFWEVPVLPPTL